MKIGLDRLSRVIETDQAMTAKILKLVKRLDIRDFWHYSLAVAVISK